MPSLELVAAAGLLLNMRALYPQTGATTKAASALIKALSSVSKPFGFDWSSSSEAAMARARLLECANKFADAIGWTLIHLPDNTVRLKEIRPVEAGR